MATIITMTIKPTTTRTAARHLVFGRWQTHRQLLKLHELNAFPWRVTFEKSEKATKGGFFPINLVSRQALDKSGGKVDF